MLTARCHCGRKSTTTPLSMASSIAFATTSEFTPYGNPAAGVRFSSKTSPSRFLILNPAVEAANLNERAYF